jgi:phosphate acetyltransferase
MSKNKNIFIATAEPYSGKSVVALGLVDMLLAKVGKVGYFKPIVNEAPEDRLDTHIETCISHFKLPLRYEDTYAFTREEANKMAEQGMQNEIIDAVIAKYKANEAYYDFTVIEGSDFLGEGAAFEFDGNVSIAKNLGAPAVIVVSGEGKTPAHIANAAIVAMKNFQMRKVKVLAIIANKVAEKDVVEFKSLIVNMLPSGFILGVIPALLELKSPTMADVSALLDAEILFGGSLLGNRADSFIFGAMQVSNFLEHLSTNALVVTPGDRSDILLSVLQAHVSNSYPKLAGIVLTGGLPLAPSVVKLVEGLEAVLPILAVQSPSFQTANAIAEIRPKIRAHNGDKIHKAIQIFRQFVDVEALEKQIIDFVPTGITPRMFQYQLVARAKAHKKHIVLPEGNDDRILIAADRLVKQGVVDITLLGNPVRIKAAATRLELSLCDDNCCIVNPLDSPLFTEYAQTFFELRKGKNTPIEVARDLMSDGAYFGTMMVYMGHADGMVSGAVHTTAHTIRPALQFVKTKPGISLVSSVFFMCLPDRVTVFGDCAINISPTAEQLSEIAISSADSAQRFGIAPRVAMLSYSSGSSGTGADVDKVREATALVKSKRPDLLVEGPIQYDAAVDLSTGRQKMPESQVAGRASVLIFPDLNTGNNTYKAVQRETGAVAIGPMLQGLNKPVNDLSRGCTIDDVFNTVVITAIQAHE